MKSRTVVITLVVASLALGISLPTAASADRGRPGTGPVYRQMPPRPGHVAAGPPHGHAPPQNRFAHPHRFRHRYPSYGYAVPYYYGGGYGLPYAYDPPDPAPVPAPSYQTVYVAPAPAVPRVVEFSTGRYELRGDGVTAPYAWVWIPNAPSAPPPAPEPPAPPAAAPAPPVVTAEAPNRPSHLYRWVDADGVVHLTDNPETVPAQFRKPVVRN